MRRFGLRLAVIAAVVFSAGGPATAVDLTGQIVDYACYVKRGAEKGSGGLHANCAKACAQKGHRLAFVTLTGEAYLLVGVTTLYNNALLLPLMDHQLVLSNVTVTQKTFTAETSEVGSTDPGRGGRGVIGSWTFVYHPKVFWRLAVWLARAVKPDASHYRTREVLGIDFAHPSRGTARDNH